VDAGRRDGLGAWTRPDRKEPQSNEQRASDLQQVPAGVGPEVDLASGLSGLRVNACLGSGTAMLTILFRLVLDLWARRYMAARAKGAGQ